MGERGPAPKRSDQRRRVNKPAIPVAKAAAGQRVGARSADESWHPIARGWYDAVGQSGQSVFYEASDWETARLCASLISQVLHGDGGAAMVAQIRGLMTDLLTTEGARRRVSLELERSGGEEAGDVSWIEDARRRLRTSD